jgi:hypothetical protein
MMRSVVVRPQAEGQEWSARRRFTRPGPPRNPRRIAFSRHPVNSPASPPSPPPLWKRIGASSCSSGPPGSDPGTISLAVPSVNAPPRARRARTPPPFRTVRSPLHGPFPARCSRQAHVAPAPAADSRCATRTPSGPAAAATAPRPAPAPRPTAPAPRAPSGSPPDRRDVRERQVLAAPAELQRHRVRRVTRVHAAAHDLAVLQRDDVAQVVLRLQPGVDDDGSQDREPSATKLRLMKHQPMLPRRRGPRGAATETAPCR